MFPGSTLRLSREACVRDKGALPITIKLKDAIILACEKYKYPFHLVDGVPRIKRGGSNKFNKSSRQGYGGTALTSFMSK